MTKIKVSELTGPALRWAVMRAEKEDFECRAYVSWCSRFAPEHHEWQPDVNWSQGGPIIEREKIGIEPYWSHGAESRRARWKATRLQPNAYHLSYFQQADTPLVAGMRCRVASKLGDEIDVPDELVI